MVLKKEMALLTNGYWNSQYWVENYWNDNYWPNYGEAELVKKFFFAQDKTLAHIAQDKTLIFIAQKQPAIFG